MGYKCIIVFLNIGMALSFNLSGPFVDMENYLNSSTTKLFDCLSNVTRTYFDRQTIYMDFGVWDTSTVDSFAKAVQSPKMIVSYSSFVDAEQQLMKGVFVFLAEDDLYLQLLNTTQQSYFVVVWTRQILMNGVRQVFRNFWKYGKHVNVIGLVMMDDGNVNAYTYRPFSNYGCSKLGRPFLLDQWNDSAFNSGTNLFSLKTKTGDMRGCSLRCVGNEHPPDAVMRHDGQKWTTSGVGGKVLDIVAKHMNFTPVIKSSKGDLNVMFSWYNSEEVLDNISAMLYAEEADLAFGWYSQATQKNAYNTELARTTSIDCLGWAVPYRAGPAPQSWTYYVYEFDKVGWLFIGTMFVIVVGQSSNFKFAYFVKTVIIVINTMHIIVLCRQSYQFLFHFTFRNMSSD